MSKIRIEPWARLVDAFVPEQTASCSVDMANVFVAYRNSDLTEGRGGNVPIAVCDSGFLAEKAAKGQSTQGSDGSVAVEKAVLINTPGDFVFAFLRRHAGPFEVQRSTEKDRAEERRAIAARALAKLTPVEREALGLLGEKP